MTTDTPKGLRELLFTGLLAALEAAEQDERPAYDHAEHLKNPDGSSRSGTPYWQAWHRAAGIRSVIHLVRNRLQTHEEHLIAERERIGSTASQVELECARHRDACPRCTAGAQDEWRRDREQDRTQRALDVYIQGVTEILWAIEGPRSSLTTADVRKALQRVQASARRVRSEPVETVADDVSEPVASQGPGSEPNLEQPSLFEVTA